MRSTARSFIVTALCCLITGSALAAAPKAGVRYLIINRDIQSFTTRYADADVQSVRREDGMIATRLRTHDGKFLSEPQLSKPETLTLVPVMTGALDAAKKAIEVDATLLDAVNGKAYAALRVKKPFAARRIIDDSPILQPSDDAVIGIRAATETLEVFVMRVQPDTASDKETPVFRAMLRDLRTKEVLGGMAWYQKLNAVMFQTRWEPQPLGISAKELGFEPDMSWAAIQLLSFARSAAAVSRGTLPQPGIAVRNEPGCDHLHWLDDGILRPCCDDHDRCFETYGCNAGLAWKFQDGWECTVCNLNVVGCFGLRYWLNVLDYLGGNLITIVDWDNTAMCYLEYPGYCPPSCFGCVFDYDFSRMAM